MTTNTTDLLDMYYQDHGSTCQYVGEHTIEIDNIYDIDTAIAYRDELENGLFIRVLKDVGLDRYHTNHRYYTVIISSDEQELLDLFNGKSLVSYNCYDPNIADRIIEDWCFDNDIDIDDLSDSEMLEYLEHNFDYYDVTKILDDISAKKKDTWQFMLGR